jgi:hypothetical protein
MMRKHFVELFLILLFLPSGCAMEARIPSPEHAAPHPENEESRLRKAGLSQVPLEESKRIVIFDANLLLETDEPDSISGQMADIAKKYNGYVLLSGNEKTAIRVSSIHLRDAIADIEGLGKVISKELTGRDVTEEYRDLEIRLDNAQKARQRYLELLSRAENVEAALKVEKELERLNQEIDLLKGQLNRLAHLEQYSTITVRIRKEIKPGLVGYIFYGLYKAVAWLFVREY